MNLLALAPDDTLLITGAAGAVGGFAVELAVRRGWRVAAVAAPSDEPLLRTWGAEWFIDRDTPDLAATVRNLIPGGADGALDTAGLGVRALAAVRTRGAFTTVAGGTTPIPLRGISIHEQWISADGPAWPPWPPPARHCASPAPCRWSEPARHTNALRPVAYAAASSSSPDRTRPNTRRPESTPQQPPDTAPRASPFGVEPPLPRNGSRHDVAPRPLLIASNLSNRHEQKEFPR